MEEPRPELESDGVDVIPYAWGVKYARKYDVEWQKIIAAVRIFYEKMRKLQIERQKMSARRKLPEETIRHITCFMDATSLCRMSETCVVLNEMCASNSLWENLCQRRFSISSFSYKSKKGAKVDESNAKELYKAALASLLSILRPKAGQYVGTNFPLRISGIQHSIPAF
jgi:hypothetical protein